MVRHLVQGEISEAFWIKLPTHCYGHNFAVLRLNDSAYFCENLYLYIFVLLSFIWSDCDLSSQIYDLFDIPVKYLGIFCC